MIARILMFARRPKRPASPGRLASFSLAILLAACGFLAASCGKDKTVRVNNLRPHVRLSGGPVQGDSASYTAEFFWVGWDEDGVIDHYQYAIDIPGRFTLEDINNPNDVGIAWRDTTVFRSRFLFTTPLQDSIFNGDGTITLPRRARGDHTLWVRAVDNEGSVSEADRVSFTARTVTPVTLIKSPKLAGQFLTVGTQFNVTWGGEDPDNPDPARRPVYYEWKLIIIPNVLTFSDPTYAVNVNPGPSYEWHRVSVDTTFTRVNLDPPKNYLFVVRAVDEAGGTENSYTLGLNAALLVASNGPFVGRPLLTVRERTLGQNVFPNEGSTVEYQLPRRKCIRCEFSADASAYGGVIQGYNYGIDVADDEAEGPNSGFRGWSLIPHTLEDICFAEPGTHVITFKVRDTAGVTTIGHYRIAVIDFPLDRDVLSIDDFLMTRDPGIAILTDEYVDRVHVNLLRDSGYSVVYESNPWGPGDLSGAVRPLKLSDMASYKMLFWSVQGTGGGLSNGVTSLLKNSSCARDRILQAYLASGGSAFIFGENVFAATKDQNGNAGGVCRGFNTYGPDAGIQMTSRDFVCEYLKVCPGDFRSAKFNLKLNGILRVRPTPTAIRERMPLIETDSTLFPVSEGGLGFVDCQFTPNFYAPGGLDTLYTPDSIRPSGFSRKPIAWRYHDLDPAPSQGPLAIFGFPLFRMKYGTRWGGPEPTAPAGTHTLGMMNAMIAWFRQHQPQAQRYLNPQ